MKMQCNHSVVICSRDTPLGIRDTIADPNYSNRLEFPNPTDSDLLDPLFSAIWNAVKYWDIRDSRYSYGYMSGNGSHVMIILNELRIAMRDKKINDILYDTK